MKRISNDVPLKKRLCVRFLVGSFDTTKDVVMRAPQVVGKEHCISGCAEIGDNGR
jgi:hypothetical protein